ncbi:hypothetical protein D3C72_2027890 [compost metagenome]
MIKEGKTANELQSEEGPVPRLLFLEKSVVPFAIRLTPGLDSLETREAESTDRIIQWLSSRYGEHTVTGYGEAYTLLFLIEAVSPLHDVQVELAEQMMRDLYDADPLVCQRTNTDG